MDDNRLVLTAVMGGRKSMVPVFLSPEYSEAERFVRRHLDRQFFCGIYLGGCGWPLTAKVYVDRKSHWAHHPGAPVCVRAGGESAADHLYVHSGLTRLLRDAFRNGGLNERIEMVGGRCHYTVISKGKTAFRVQYTNLSPQRYEHEDRILRRRFTQVQWIIGPSAASTADMIEARKGWVLRTHCRTKGGTREVLVRVDGGAGRFDWVPLSECMIDDDGRVSGPVLREQRKQHEAKFTPPPPDPPPAAPTPEPSSPPPPAVPTDIPDDATVAEAVRPVLAHLEAAVARGDLGNLESHLEVRKTELRWLRRSGLVEEQERLRRITNWHMQVRSGVVARPASPVGNMARQVAKKPFDRRTGPEVRSAPKKRKRSAREAEARSLRGSKATPNATKRKPIDLAQAESAGWKTAARPAKPGPPPLRGIAAELDRILGEAARAGGTVAWSSLPTGWDRTDIADALAEVERRTPADAPLLTSLIVADDRKVHRILRDVLVRLGRPRVSSDFGLAILGVAEREKVYAFYARSGVTAG